MDKLAIEQSKFPEILAQHIQQLDNLEVENPKLMVCFAGPPGSGKTTLARAIEDKYKGVRISTDDIRKLIADFKSGLSIDQSNDIARTYHDFLLNRLGDIPNGLLVIDSGIERKYEQVSTAARENGYELVVIDIFLPKDVLETRIKQSKSNPQDYLPFLDNWIKDHEAFREAEEADFVVDEDTKIEEVVKVAEEILESVSR
ncbi:MAG: AAA family ATPase [Candidatus Saccharimonadales bacterium]